MLALKTKSPTRSHPGHASRCKRRGSLRQNIVMGVLSALLGTAGSAGVANAQSDSAERNYCQGAVDDLNSSRCRNYADQVKTNAKVEADRLRKRVRELEASIRSYDRRFRQRGLDLQNARQSLRAERETAVKLQNDFRRLSEDYKSLKRTGEAASGRSAEYRKRIAELSSQKSELETSAAELESEVARLRAEVASLRQSINEPRLEATTRCSNEVLTAPRGTILEFRIPKPCRTDSRFDFFVEPSIGVTAATFAALGGADRGFSFSVPYLGKRHAYNFADPASGEIVRRQLEAFSGPKTILIVLEWHGEIDLNLHVLENGAQIGRAGHAWHGSSGPSAGRIVLHQSGETRQNPRFEVYEVSADRADGMTFDARVEFASRLPVAQAPFCGRGRSTSPTFEVHVIADGRRLRTSGIRQFEPIECGGSIVNRYRPVLRFKSG